MLAMKLKDRVAIITGAASGIGLAGAHTFAHEGARVIIADIDAKAAPAVEKAIRNTGGQAYFVQTDVSKSEQVQAMMAAVIGRYGRLDILWNNATALRDCSEHDAPVHSLPEAEWDFMRIPGDVNGAFR